MWKNKYFQKIELLLKHSIFCDLCILPQLHSPTMLPQLSARYVSELCDSQAHDEVTKPVHAKTACGPSGRATSRRNVPSEINTSLWNIIDCTTIVTHFLVNGEGVLMGKIETLSGTMCLDIHRTIIHGWQIHSRPSDIPVFLGEVPMANVETVYHRPNSMP